MRQLSVRIALESAAEKGQRPRGNVNENGSELCGCSPPSPSVVCFFFCVHTLLSLSSSSSLARAFSEGDTHSFPPTRFPPTTGHPTPAGSSAFLFCALGLASCCVLLCRVRDLCHTECKYMSKHAKHFTDHDMSRHTHICTRPLSVLHTNTSILCECVCANGKFGDCLQTRYVRAPNAASKAFTFHK